MKKLLMVLLSLILSVSLTCSLAACGGSSKEKDKETEEESAREEDEEEGEDEDEGDPSKEEKSSEKTKSSRKKASSKTLTGLSYDYTGNGNDPGNLYDYNSIVFYEDSFYIADDGETVGIYRVPIEGGTAQCILETEESARNFSIADGYLYFSAGTQIARVPLEGGEAEILNDVNDQGYVDLGAMMIYNGLLFYTYTYGYESLSVSTNSKLDAMDPDTGEIMTWRLGDSELGLDNVIWGSKEGIYSAQEYEGQMFLYPWSGLTKETCLGGENEAEWIEHYSFRVNDSDSYMFGSDARIYEMEDGTVGIFEYKGRLEEGGSRSHSEPDKILFSYEQNGNTGFFKSMCKYELSGCYVGIGLNRGSIATYDADFQPINTPEEVHPNSGGGVSGKYKDHVYYFSYKDNYTDGQYTDRDYALYVIDKNGNIEEKEVSLS